MSIVIETHTATEPEAMTAAIRMDKESRAVDLIVTETAHGLTIKRGTYMTPAAARRALKRIPGNWTRET